MPRTGGTPAGAVTALRRQRPPGRGPGRHRRPTSARSGQAGPGRQTGRAAGARAETAQRAVSGLAPRSEKVTGAPAARSPATIALGRQESLRQSASRWAGQSATNAARGLHAGGPGGQLALVQPPALGGHLTRRVEHAEGALDARPVPPSSRAARPARAPRRSRPAGPATWQRRRPWPTPTWAPWRPVGTPVRMAAMSSRWLMACSAPDRGAVRPTAPSARPLRVIRSHSQAEGVRVAGPRRRRRPAPAARRHPGTSPTIGLVIATVEAHQVRQPPVGGSREHRRQLADARLVEDRRARPR